MNEQDLSVPVAPEWCFDDTLAVESYTELLEDAGVVMEAANGRVGGGAQD